MKILKQSGTVIWLILLYLIPVLIVTGLRFKASQIDNKTLDPLFTTRFYLTAVIADIGFGYYLSRLFFRFFKPAVWICSFVFWFIAFACLISFVLTHNLPNESIFINGIRYDLVSYAGLSADHTFSRICRNGVLLGNMAVFGNHDKNT